MSHSSVFYRKPKRSKPVVSHGEGIYLYDDQGKQYIDASGGAIVVNVGHGIREIADAIGDQAAQVAYAHASMFTSQPLEKLSVLLAERLPMPDARLYFQASGAEAVETAIKFARQVQIAKGESGRYKVIGRWGSYHGATLGALAVMGKPSMRAPYAPMFTDMPHIPAPYCYRCPFGSEYPACGLRCADALEDEILRQGVDTVAAFIAEPIAGATLGAVVPPDGYLERIREICDRHGVLLIVDEVMTGMGRVGRWFAVEQWPVTPDVVVMGKGLSGGYFPLSAAAMRGEWVELVWNKLGDFNHGGTFSHQPVGAAAGIATIEYIEKHDLLDAARSTGKLLGDRLLAAFGDHDHVGDIRGQGLLWALELVRNRQAKEPFSPGDKLAEKVFDAAFAGGLIVYAMAGCVDGRSGDHVMIAPPLIVQADQIEVIVSRLARSIDGAVAVVESA